MSSQAASPGARRTALPTRPSRDQPDVSKRPRGEPSQPGDDSRSGLEARASPSLTRTADVGGLSPHPGPVSPTSLPAETVHDGASSYREHSVESYASQGQPGQVC